MTLLFVSGRCLWGGLDWEGALLVMIMRAGRGRGTACRRNSVRLRHALAHRDLEEDLVRRCADFIGGSHQG